jgi:hypothetical protein
MAVGGSCAGQEKLSSMCKDGAPWGREAYLFPGGRHPGGWRFEEDAV